MDAVIRFCFFTDPEGLDEDEYAKLYGQAKWIWDNLNLINARKAIAEL